MRRQFILIAFNLAILINVQAQWSLTGNAITAGNFLGTTNFQNLVFKASGSNSALIDVSYSNTAFGMQSWGTISATATQNSSFGQFAFQHNSSGYQNAAIGYLSLNQNSSGASNTSAGENSMYYNTTGAGNAAIGQYALYANTTANFNNAFGGFALKANTTGTLNSAFGNNSLLSNVSGYNLCVLGYNANYSNTSGYENIAIGYSALYSSISDFRNIAIGANAMYGTIGTSYNPGTQNIVIGASAAHGNGGQWNTIIGDHAMYTFTSTIILGTPYEVVINDCAFGASAAYYSAYQGDLTVTAMGAYAFPNISTGGGVAVGYDAGENSTTGIQDTWVGYLAAPESGLYNLTNATAIGYLSYNFASNQVVIGNSSMTSIGGYAPSGWTVFPSDRRFKKNVKENVPGLVFIKQLKPITYNADISGINSFLHVGQQKGNDSKNREMSTDEKSIITQKEKIICSGFIAQDVETAAKKIGYDFSAVNAPKDDKGLYGLGYEEFVVPLVKATQELSNGNDSLQDFIADLQNQINNLQQQLIAFKTKNTATYSEGVGNKLKESALNSSFKKSIGTR